MTIWSHFVPCYCRYSVHGEVLGTGYSRRQRCWLWRKCCVIVLAPPPPRFRMKVVANSTILTVTNTLYITVVSTNEMIIGWTSESAKILLQNAVNYRSWQSRAASQRWDPGSISNPRTITGTNDIYKHLCNLKMRRNRLQPGFTPRPYRKVHDTLSGFL